MGQTSESAKRLWQDPIYAERIVAATAKGKATPESIAKRSQIGRDLWKNPEYREKMANKNPPPNKLSEDERVKKICPICRCVFSVLPCKAKRITCSQECRKARKRSRGVFKQTRLCEACQHAFAPKQYKQSCCKTCVPTHEAGLRWRLFKLTQAAYDLMLVAQGNACRICYVPFTSIPKRQMQLDHCHITGRVRGLLCQRCNRLVGELETNSRLIQPATEYINEFRS